MGEDGGGDDAHARPVLKFAVNWKNRWWGEDATVENRIWFTDLFQSQAWYALYYIDIPFERGDAITALVALGDTLVVFGGTKSYLIIGTTSLDFEVRPTAGCRPGRWGHNAVASHRDGHRARGVRRRLPVRWRARTSSCRSTSSRAGVT